MATHANRGLTAENLIEFMNTRYRNEGCAQITKIATEWLPIRGANGKIVSAKVVRKADVDYIGNFGGTTLAFDVKSVAKGRRWPLRNLDPEQLSSLALHDGLGGLAFVVLVFWESGKVFVLPFEYIHAKVTAYSQGGPASLTAEMLEKDFEPLPVSAPDYLRRVLGGYFRPASPQPAWKTARAKKQPCNIKRYAAVGNMPFAQP
jgi:recombination protein U